jgi:acetyl/propionyl-CoA carboxylase alpha subunit
VLAAGYEKGVDLYTVDELCATVTEAVERMNEQYPSNRVRLKAISGGGGKGQRILGIGEAARATEMVREILNEVKTTGVGDNKNVLVELNIETTRHQEIQVIGNGDWCITLGGRDCSLQMHEQKLLEVSVTVESLHKALTEATAAGRETEARSSSRISGPWRRWRRRPRVSVPPWGLIPYPPSSASSTATSTFSWK